MTKIANISNLQIFQYKGGRENKISCKIPESIEFNSPTRVWLGFPFKIPGVGWRTFQDSEIY